MTLLNLMGGIAFLTPAAEARAKSEAEGQRRKSLEVGRKIIGGKRKSNYGQLLFFTFQAKFILWTSLESLDLWMCKNNTDEPWCFLPIIEIFLGISIAQIV